MHKLLPILLVVILSACGGKATEFKYQCINTINSKSIILKAIIKNQKWIEMAVFSQNEWSYFSNLKSGGRSVYGTRQSPIGKVYAEWDQHNRQFVVSTTPTNLGITKNTKYKAFNCNRI